MKMNTYHKHSARSILSIAQKRATEASEAWKNFEGIFEFVLHDGASLEPRTHHLVLANATVTLEDGPSPVMPSVRVSMSEDDFVLYARGILNEELAHRQGRMHVEGDMYIVHKLPSLVLIDSPLYEFAD